MKSIQVEALHKELQGKSKDRVLIDVRTSGEYSLSKIPNAKNIPLDEIQEFVNDLAAYKTVYVHCQSGNRSGKACEKLKELGLTNVVNVEGGLSEWQRFDLPVEKKKGAIPIMRQVLITAGALVLLGCLLAILVHPYFLLLTIGVSIGLLFSGISGACPMAKVLGKMPWNNN